MKYVQTKTGVLVPDRRVRKHQRGFLNPGICFWTHGGSSPTLNYFDPSRVGANIVLSNSDATATKTGSGWTSVAGVTAHSTGKWYAECTNDVTVSSAMMFGIAPTSMPVTAYPGSTSTSYGEQPNNTSGARTYNNGAGSTFSGTIAAGGSGCLAVDFDAGKIWFGDSNGGGRWYKGDPSTGATPIYTFTPGVELTLMLGLFANTQQCTLRNNPGQNALTIPSGFSIWG